MTQSSDVILDVNQVWKRYGSTPAVGQGKAARILFDSLLGFGAKGPVTGAGEQDIIKGLSFSLARARQRSSGCWPASSCLIRARCGCGARQGQ